MHTCYSLCTNEVLNLDYQISITPLGSCSSLHSKGVSQLNIWARELSWTSRRGIYTPYFKTYSLESNSAHFGVTGRSGQSDRTRSVSGQWLHDTSPVIRDRTLTSIRSPPIRHVWSKNFLLWILIVVDRTLPLVRLVTTSSASGRKANPSNMS